MHEEAEAAGLRSVYNGPWEFFVGGGGAAFDCDGSGFPSVFLADGKNPARLFVNKSKAGGPLKFEEKALDIGADPKLLSNVIGAYPLDIDGDGHMDLFVLRVGGNLLLKGGPDCTFTLANHEWNFDGDSGWTTSFAAEWEPGQKFPTLAIGHYVDRDAPGSPWGTCADNSLYRPQPGDKPDYSVRTPLAPGFCALSMLFTDWNKSGVPSLRVSNDRQYYRGGEEQMWRIDPGKTPRLYSRADGWRHLSIYGMGIAEGDLDGSGYPEYFLTSMGDEKLQKLDPEAAERGEAPVYRDIAGEVGVTAHIPYTGGDKRPSTAWHAEFADFNNDGLSDIFVSKGNLEQMPDFAAYDPSNASSRFERTKDGGSMRIIGLDIHRAFAEAVAWDDGKLKRLGRVDMRRPLLEAFAKKLTKQDVVVVEATGNAASRCSGDRASCQESCDRESKASAHHRSCQDQDRYDRRRRTRSTLCKRLSA